MLDLVVDDADPFGFELLLHGGESAKMVFSGEDSEAIDDPMGGNVRQAVCGIHGVAHGSRSAGAAQVARNGAVARDASGWNLANYRVDPLKKVRLGGAHAKRNLR